jgi:hypothetical protein
MAIEIVLNGYYEIGNRVFQIKSIQKTCYYCHVYGKSGELILRDYWSKSYINCWVSRRVKPKNQQQHLTLGGKVQS